MAYLIGNAGLIGANPDTPQPELTVYQAYYQAGREYV